MKNGYGFDRLSRDALIVAASFSFVGVIAWNSVVGMIFCAISTLLIALVLFRALSERIEPRQDELIGYENIINTVSGYLSGLYAKVFKKNGAGQVKNAKPVKDPAYKYFKCPKCKKEYRAPKGKGKIRVTCRECGEQFDKNV